MAGTGSLPEPQSDNTKSLWVRWRPRFWFALPTIGFLIATLLGGPLKKAYDDVVGAHADGRSTMPKRLVLKASNLHHV
jgi:hypothetical protein